MEIWKGNFHENGSVDRILEIHKFSVYQPLIQNCPSSPNSVNASGGLKIMGRLKTFLQFSIKAGHFLA